MSTMTAELNLEGEVRWRAKAGSGHSLIIDGPKNAGGTDAGFRPMELMLIGLGGCIGFDTVMILRRMRHDVSGYQLKLIGVRTDELPSVFTSVKLEHIIRGQGLTPEVVQRALALAEQKYCSAWAMFAKTAALTNSFRVEV